MPVVTLTKANSIAKDTRVNSANPTTNYATSIGILVGTTGSSGINRSFVKFDLGLIPNDAVINSAILKLTQTSGVPPAGQQEVKIYPITSDWVDTSTTWNVQPTYSTSVSSSFLTGAASSVLQPDIKDIVQKWVNGELTNYGIILKSDNEGLVDADVQFGAFEQSTVANQPTLTIDYTIPSTGKKQVEVIVDVTPPAYTASGTSVTPSLPSGVQAGDLMVAQVFIQSGALPVTFPSGWTTILTTAVGGSYQAFIATKTHSGNESNPIITCGGTTAILAKVSAFRNVQSVIRSFGHGKSSNTTAYYPCLSSETETVSKEKSLLVIMNAIAGSYAFTQPLSYTEAYDVTSTRTMQMVYRYMHTDLDQTFTEMQSTASASVVGASQALFLEPIANNPPTLSLTSPADNQTLSEGSSYPIEGIATDPDVGDIVSIWCKVNNTAKRAIGSGVSDGSSPISFAKAFRFSNRRLWDGSNDIVGYDLAENTKHLLTVWAEDDKGGKSAEVTREFTVVWNRPPTIDGQDEDLGTTEVSPSKTYAVTDPEGDSFTITEKVNSTVIRSFPGVTGRQETITIPLNIWLQLEPGIQHVLQIEAVDSNGMRSVRTYTFTRFENQCEFEIEEPWETDVAAKRILFTPDMILPPGAILTAEACNNGFDAVPTWEDISFHAQFGRGYVFNNTQKTAAKWGVNIRMKVEKGTATEPVIIKGFGGAFD